MTDPAEDFESHARFEAADDGWTPTTNDWDAHVTADPDRVRVTVELPTLDAVVEGEPVAPVVEDGWFETFELRVEDVDGVTYAENVETAVSRGATRVTVETSFDPRAGRAAEDALAVVNYVEGTWFEGVIPGYDYIEKVQAMREQASQNAEGERSGTPL